MKKKICMLVRNPVTRDARVLKEATTLINDGYDVSIIGIQDANHSTSFLELENGIKVFRVPWKAKRAEILFLLTLGAAVLASLLLIYLIYLIYLIDFKAALELLISNPTLILGLVPLIIGLIPFFFLAKFFIIKLRKIKNIISFEKTREEFPSELMDDQLTEKKFKHLKLMINPLKWKEYLQGIKKSFSYFINQALSYYSYNRSAAILAQKINPQLIHAHDIATLPAGVKIKKKLQCKLIYDAHEIYEGAVGVPQAGRLLYILINKLLLNTKHLDGFITINDSFIQFYKSRYKKCPNATLIMNATVKAEPFKYDGRLHKSIGVDDDKKIILFQGGFSKKRGVLDLLEAAPYLDDDWVLVFMGWGWYESAILRAVEQLPSKIFMIPPAPHNELVLWTAGASVGVIPYEEHGLNHKYCTPNKLWEYPNAGVPIFASPRVEIKQIVEKNNLGKIFNEPVSPKKFASQMMFSNKEIEEYKKNSETFLQNNSWARYETSLIELYLKVLN